LEQVRRELALLRLEGKDSQQREIHAESLTEQQWGPDWRETCNSSLIAEPVLSEAQCQDSNSDKPAPQPWLAFPVVFTGVLIQLSQDLKNANGSLLKSLLQRQYEWWNHCDQQFHADDNRRHFEACTSTWLTAMCDSISLRTKQLINRRASPKDAAAMARAVIEQCSRVADIFRACEHFLMLGEILPHGVNKTEFENVQTVAQEMEMKLLSKLDYIVREAEIEIAEKLELSTQNGADVGSTIRDVLSSATPDSGRPCVSVDQLAPRSSGREAIIRPILTKIGFSICDWATAAKVDFHTADNYLKGKSSPHPSTLKKLAEALQLTPDALPK
jgi:hypothetical protein